MSESEKDIKKIKIQKGIRKIKWQWNKQKKYKEKNWYN